MFGHSLGGYITLAFAELYPQYLTGFSLVHSTANPDSEEAKEARARMQRRFRMRERDHLSKDYPRSYFLLKILK